MILAFASLAHLPIGSVSKDMPFMNISATWLFVFATLYQT